MLKNIAKYVLGPIAEQHINAFRPSDGWRAMLVMYLDVYVKIWVVGGFIGFLVCFYLSKISGNQYFYLAIKQVLSPLFWNIVAAFGLLFASAAIIFISINAGRVGNYMLNSSQAFLCFASEIGALMYGVLVGMFVVAASHPGASSFRMAIHLSGGIIGLLLVLTLNLIVWWLAFCIKNQHKSPAYFKYVKDRKVLMFLMSVSGFFIFVYILLTTTPTR